MNVHKQKAIPGYSLYSYNLITKKVKFVSKEEFTPEEIESGVEKYYTFFSGQVIYKQEKSRQEAKKKFNQFIAHKFQNQLTIVKWNTKHSTTPLLTTGSLIWQQTETPTYTRGKETYIGSVLPVDIFQSSDLWHGFQEGLTIVKTF